MNLMNVFEEKFRVKQPMHWEKPYIFNQNYSNDVENEILQWRDVWIIHITSTQF